MPRPFTIDRLSLKLGLTVSMFVVVALAVGFHLTYAAYRDELLAMTRVHTEVEARLVRLALTHEMLEGDDRTLIERTLRSFADEAPVERVMILDRDGLVQFSSDPEIRERHFAIEDPTCQVCHQTPADVRTHSTVLELEGGTVLRSVQPIPNDVACHECHDPEHRINGVLIVDVPVGATIQRIESSVQRLALGTAAVGLILIGGIGVAFRRFLLRRLFRFEAAARAIAQGQLARRVPVEGNDALTRLEIQFNRMADSVVGLLHRVEEQAQRLRRVMNGVDDGMVVLEPDLRIAAVNDAFIRRFPGKQGELVGCTCVEVVGAAGVHCLRLQPSECPALQSFRTGQVHTAIHTRTAPDGRPRHEEIRASPLLGDDGKVARVVEVWRDITDRRSAEARLADYQRMASVGMLASGFSHEINTPLGSIGTCLEAIGRVNADEVSPDPERREQIRGYAQIGSEQVERCATITRQFLRLARGRSPDQEILDVRSIAEQVARLVAPTARLAGVAIELEPASPDRPPLPPVLASSSSVQQVLLNLILNAIEASAKGRTVRVSFADGAELEVQVRDEGVGLAADDVPRLFEPFFTRRAAGTGLGLFVSVNLARGWGGDVRLVSTAPGEGTTFAATFPRPASAP